MVRARNERLVRWDSLHRDLLEMVVARLDIADHARLICVCKLWRSVATAIRVAVRKPLPSISVEHPQPMIGRLLGSPSWAYARSVGCFDPWLVLEKKRGRLSRPELFLLNTAAASGAPVLPLPPLPHDVLYIFKVVLSSPPSSRDCVMVLSCLGGNESSGLYYYRPGGDVAAASAASWTLFYDTSDTKEKLIGDLTFCQDRLYTINNLWSAGIHVFDSIPNSKPPTTFLIFPPPRGFYLSPNDGKLLVIQAEWRDWCPANVFCVYELDPKNWSIVKVESIGNNNILFATSVSCLLLSAKDHPDFPPNHLYKFKPGCTEFTSYSFADKTIKRDNTMEGRCMDFSTLFAYSCFNPYQGYPDHLTLSTSRKEQNSPPPTTRHKGTTPWRDLFD